MNGEMYEKIKALRIQHGMSQDELASKTGYTSRSSIAKVESGLVDISQSKIQAFAEALYTTPQYLMGYDQKSSAASIYRIPLYSSISCGTGIFIDDTIDDYISIPDKYVKRGKEYFANTAKGDSMVGKGIKNGDVLVFEKTNTLVPGEIGCFCIDNNDAVCKVYRQLPSGLILLESANEKYQPIEIDIASSDCCFRIVGKYRFKFSVEQ